MKPLVPLFLAILAFPLAAQPLPRNEFNLSAGRTDFNGRYMSNTFGVSYSRFWKDAGSTSISTRIGAFKSDHSFPDERGSTYFRAIHADLGLHFRTDRLVSPRVSAGLARSEWEVDPYESESDSRTTLIGSAGVDFNLRRHFALGAELSFIPFTPNPRDRFAQKLNPATGLVSARFRW